MREKRRKGELPSAVPGFLLNLQKELCQGCTHCLRVCPTEAIRIRRGKAEVMLHRCVQCGECIRVCPWEAWIVHSNSPDPGKADGDAWAVLDPSVFGQFGRQTPPQGVMNAFLRVGFSAVKEMTEGYEIYREAVSSLLSSEKVSLPAISSDCPAVVQLVQVKFPSLLENLVSILPPSEIMASELKKGGREGSPRNLYYIVPCLAKAQASVDPLSPEGGFKGAIPLADLFNSLKASLHHKEGTSFPLSLDKPSTFGMQWAFPGGESKALGIKASLTVDGIHRVAGVLELAENGLLDEVPFIEAWSCPGGCLGGPLNVQNPFLAQFQVSSWIRIQSSSQGRSPKVGSQTVNRYRLGKLFAPRAGMRLDEDLRVAMEKLRRIGEVVKRFPGIDCGSCGCPNCLALAEDIVQGHAQESDCLYVLKGEKTTRSRGKERLPRWKRQRREGKRG